MGYIRDTSSTYFHFISIGTFFLFFDKKIPIFLTVQSSSHSFGKKTILNVNISLGDNLWEK